MDSKPDRLNVIWILGDQHGAYATSYNGNPDLSTPHLDRMANEGVNFRRAVAGFPLCCPFRGSMLSGRYPHHCIPGHEYPWPDGMPSLAAPLEAAGYRTAYFGKWHCDGFKEREGRAAFHVVPRHRRGGFGTWIGYENNNDQYSCYVHGHDEQQGELERHRLAGYETDSLTDLLIGFLRRQAPRPEGGGGARPFFAVLSVQPPHDPNLAPPEWMARHRPGEVRLRPNVPPIEAVRTRARRALAGYYAQIENLDWNVGRVRAALEECGLRDTTCLMFFSDHGDMMGAHGQFAKTTPHAESLNVPFLVAGGASRYRGDGIVAPRTVDFPINHVDIAPTTLGLCGVRAPEWMAGFDYAGLVLGRDDAPTPPDSAYIQQVVPTRHSPGIDRPWRGIVTADGWKYAALEGQPWMLFDTNEDPFELRNMALVGYGRARLRELNARLADWIARTGDTFTLPEV